MLHKKILHPLVEDFHAVPEDRPKARPAAAYENIPPPVLSGSGTGFKAKRASSQPALRQPVSYTHLIRIIDLAFASQEQGAGLPCDI